jgi:hypothetical protein
MEVDYLGTDQEDPNEGEEVAHGKFVLALVKNSIQLGYGRECCNGHVDKI